MGAQGTAVSPAGDVSELPNVAICGGAPPNKIVRLVRIQSEGTGWVVVFWFMLHGYWFNSCSWMLIKMRFFNIGDLWMVFFWLG